MHLDSEASEKLSHQVTEVYIEEALASPWAGVNACRRDQPRRINLNAGSLLFEENSLIQQYNSLFVFQNSLFS
jgi:hypothetical protein